MLGLNIVFRLTELAAQCSGWWSSTSAAQKRASIFYYCDWWLIVCNTSSKLNEQVPQSCTAVEIKKLLWTTGQSNLAYKWLGATKASKVWFSYSYNCTLASGAVFHFACQVWLSSGLPEFSIYSYCTWLWNWLPKDKSLSYCGVRLWTTLFVCLFYCIHCHLTLQSPRVIKCKFLIFGIKPVVCGNARRNWQVISCLGWSLKYKFFWHQSLHNVDLVQPNLMSPLTEYLAKNVAGPMQKIKQFLG